jgi:integrase
MLAYAGLRVSEALAVRWRDLDLETGRLNVAAQLDRTGRAVPLKEDELAHGREGMSQPFHCLTPEEAALTHRLFTAALTFQRERSVVAV